MNHILLFYLTFHLESRGKVIHMYELKLKLYYDIDHEVFHVNKIILFYYIINLNNNVCSILWTKCIRLLK